MPKIKCASFKKQGVRRNREHLWVQKQVYRQRNPEQIWIRCQDYYQRNREKFWPEHGPIVKSSDTNFESNKTSTIKKN